MKKIDFEKCEKIYKELEEQHRNVVYDESHTLTYNAWTSSAREIKADLDNYYYRNEINMEEVQFIFGKVCSSALSFSKGDFWRV